MQIFRTLTGQSEGWASHPAVKMWAGYEHALCAYGYIVCAEWRCRGYFDTALDFFDKYLQEFPDWSDSLLPAWFGNAPFHASHRSNLLRKLPEHYSKFGWGEPSDLEYVWPEAKNHD